MATIDRRTTAELITEHQRRVGKYGDSGYVARSKEFISWAHRFCASNWHHYQLDTTETALAVSAGANTISVSSQNPLVIAHVDLRTPAGTVIGPLTPHRIESLLGTVDPTTNGQPTKWARWGNSIYLDRNADLAYKVNVYYYKRPSDLDDATGNLALGEEWDEAVLLLSVAQARSSLWAPAAGTEAMNRFGEVVASLSNPLLLEAPLYAEAIRSTGQMMKPHGGAQG